MAGKSNSLVDTVMAIKYLEKVTFNQLSKTKLLKYDSLEINLKSDEMLQVIELFSNVKVNCQSIAK